MRAKPTCSTLFVYLFAYMLLINYICTSSGAHVNDSKKFSCLTNES